MNEKGTIMLTQEYAPCPSCQGNYIHVAEWYSEAGETEYYCVCDECGYEDPDRFDDPYVAIDHWSRRVSTGYLGGEDPTDTEFDKLDESDWEEDDIDYDFLEVEKKDKLPRRTRIEYRNFR